MSTTVNKNKATKHISLRSNKTLKATRTLKHSITIKNIENLRTTTSNLLETAEEEKFNENIVDPTLYGFAIDSANLENIMGNYRDRVLYNNNNNVKEYPDLLFFEEEEGIQTLLDSLNTDIINGITSNEGREEVYGSNKNYIEEVPPFCSFLWEAFEDFMTRVLIICAIVSIALGCTLSDEPSKDWIDGVSIIIAVLVVVLVGSITNYQKEKQFRKLNQVQQEGTKYQIIRNGQLNIYSSDDILVGDLILVNYGDIIPADLLLVEGNGIKIDESSLTGEPYSVSKEDFYKCEEIKKRNEKYIPSPLIMSGTNCVEGSGKGIVLCVGEHSIKSIYRRIVENDQETLQTPLAEKLDNITGLIGYFGLIAGVTTLLALLIRFGIEFYQNMKEFHKHNELKIIMNNFLFNFPHKRIDPNVLSNADNEVTDPKSMIAKKILDIVILCISIIVVAIPEGLPSAATLSLAFSLKNMMDNDNLVRRIHACETMGGANYLCTDKTGTLTLNEMKVSKILIGNEIKDLQDEDYCLNKKKIRESYTHFFKNEVFWNTLKISIALNVECQIKKLKKKDINGDESCDTRNKTDKAFIDFLYRFKTSMSKELDKYLYNNNNYKQLPFDSKRKRMTTYIYNSEFPTEYRLFTKGGGEKSISFCCSFMNPNTGNVEKIDENFLNNIKNTIFEFNKEGLRTLYIAYKDITKEDFDSYDKPNENGLYIDEYNLVFLAIFAIEDPIRKGVKDAVKKCEKASVNVIIVTGDNIVTATSIAKSCGILSNDIDLDNLETKDIEPDPDLLYDKSKKDEYLEMVLREQPRVLTGDTFYEIIGGLICKECDKDINLCKCPRTEEEAKKLAEKEDNEDNEDVLDIKKEKVKNMKNFKKITRNLKVIARSQPIHKYALILGLKSLKNVVAVTGDGTNDAPSLSKSDVGIAMFSGTDIAKDASDIVLMNNNFSGIIVAIIYGRNIYKNIRKFLQFQLSVNFSACLTVFFCSIIGNETPITGIQLLWINLIMDSFGSLALATEPPYEELLLSEPTKRNESIINGHMWKHIFLQSIVLFALMLFLYLYAPKFIEEDNIVKIAENTIIRYCYGKIPGSKKNPLLIISGVSNDWSSTVKLRSDINKEYCGSYASRQTLNLAFKEYFNINSGSVHMTMIFNIFVFYTLFNQINCRILDDSFNIFKRIHKSYLFISITIFEIIIQIIIVSFGNTVFHVTYMGLTGKQWLICIAFSAITFVVSIFGKIITLDRAIDKCLVYEDVMEDEDFEDEHDENGKKKLSKNDFDISSSVRSIKVDETNNYDENKKKDDIDNLKMSDFTNSTEKKSINN